MARLKFGKASRAAYAKSGIALPDGKFPIPDKAHFRAAIAYKHKTSEPYPRVKAHILRRAKDLGVTVHLSADFVEELAQGPGKRQGRSNSLKWPWLYDKLVAKGYDHTKAAAISNSRIGTRKNGRISVLSADQAHNSKVLKRIAAADKRGKHVTRKQLTASARAYEFACHSAACAPPPAGVGGSKSAGGRSLSRRVGASFKIETSGMTREQITSKIARIEAANVKTTGAARTLKALRAQLSSTEHPVITKAEARGDSRPVSHEEFQRLAIEGQKQLDKFAADKSPTTGLNQHWDSIKAEAHAEVLKPWGGATYDSHTGKALPQGADVYAITVKSGGSDTVSVKEGASAAEFGAAMDKAKAQFGSILERQQHYLGVFHDDENHRIDIDPVLIVKTRKEVDTVGAATRAIGGAYHFKSGDGFWPPHVGK